MSHDKTEAGERVGHRVPGAYQETKPIVKEMLPLLAASTIETGARIADIPDATPDTIKQPGHYARWAIEPLTFILANSLSFPVGNVIKYVVRYPFKNGLDDLRKARRYIDVLIADEEAKLQKAKA